MKLIKDGRSGYQSRLLSSSVLFLVLSFCSHGSLRIFLKRRMFFHHSYELSRFSFIRFFLKKERTALCIITVTKLVLMKLPKNLYFYLINIGLTFAFILLTHFRAYDLQMDSSPSHPSLLAVSFK